MIGGRADNNNASSQNYMSDNSAGTAPASFKSDAKQPAYANDLDDDIPF
jgi:hypothetical protein